MQEQSATPSVADCLMTMQQYPAKQAEAAKKAGQPMNYRTWQKEAKELGGQCATRFKVPEVSGADLIALSRLYLSTDKPDLAREAINRRLKTPNLTETERAEALVAAISVVLNGTPTDESIKLGEDYTAQTDALSDAQLRQKINAHSRMAGYYGYMDVDAPNLLHQSILLKLIAQTSETDRQTFEGLRASAYDHIALVQANRGQMDKANETLQQAKTAVKDPRMASMFDDAIARYSLIGQRVPPVKGTYWLNAPPDTKQFDTTGRVTLIQFTAHWCAPCRKSYPAMLKMHEKFAARGLDVMLATELYGYFEQQYDLKPEQELAADREYFTGKYKIPFKIAIEPLQNYADRTPAGEAARSEFNMFKYRVGGIPQIMLIDKQGVLRHILIGWDPANEAAISSEIEQLLKEPVVTPNK